MIFIGTDGSMSLDDLEQGWMIAAYDLDLLLDHLSTLDPAGKIKYATIFGVPL